MNALTTTNQTLPHYETNPDLAPKKAPALSPEEMKGFILSQEQAYDLTRKFLARAPIWTLYDETNETRPGEQLARLYLTHPGEITATGYILTAKTDEEKEKLKSFFENNFVEYAADPTDPTVVITNYIPPEFA